MGGVSVGRDDGPESPNGRRGSEASPGGGGSERQGAGGHGPAGPDDRTDRRGGSGIAPTQRPPRPEAPSTVMVSRRRSQIAAPLIRIGSPFDDVSSMLIAEPGREVMRAIPVAGS